jgi:sugar lactone lactonase YvrE
LERFAVLLVSVLAMGLLVSCGDTVVPGQFAASSPAFNDRLVAADQGNNRVLIYGAPLSTDESASIVLGQPDFTQNLPDQSSWDSSAATLSGPFGVAMDGAGDLWVADTYDCRAVEFRPPFTTDMGASIVIGQSQFSELVEWPACFTTGASGMMGPDSLAFDARGDLWVSDMFAGRITEYVPPFHNGMAASVSIGQTNVNEESECDGQPFEEEHGPLNTQPPTASTLCGPGGITFDSDGDLWVADYGNDRVLEFTPPFSTGMAASLEIGQPAAAPFTSLSSQGVSAATVGYPQSLAFDSSGNLWIADYKDDRVLEFVPPFTNGMAASLVLGQPDFTQTTYVYPPTANTIAGPGGLFFDSSGNLLVSDEHSRIVVFAPPFRDGMSASEVIGQPNMTSGGCTPPTADTLCGAMGIITF